MATSKSKPKDLATSLAQRATRLALPHNGEVGPACEYSLEIAPRFFLIYERDDDDKYPSSDWSVGYEIGPDVQRKDRLGATGDVTESDARRAEREAEAKKLGVPISATYSSVKTDVITYEKALASAQKRYGEVKGWTRYTIEEAIHDYVAHLRETKGKALAEEAEEGLDRVSVGRKRFVSAIEFAGLDTARAALVTVLLKGKDRHLRREQNYALANRIFGHLFAALDLAFERGLTGLQSADGWQRYNKPLDPNKSARNAERRVELASKRDAELQQWRERIAKEDEWRTLRDKVKLLKPSGRLAYSVEDAATLLGGVPVAAIEKLIQDGQLETIDIAGSRVIPKRSIEEFLKRKRA